MSEQRTAYRILDASANRASEGLRTLEEFARFGLDDSARAADWKGLRHSLQQSMSRFSRESLLSARDTNADVGTQISEPTEYVREDLIRVIQAASSRVQQSLRVMEEYGKTVDPEAAKQFEQIRYRCYTAAADLELLAGRSGLRQRLTRSHLYVLIDAAGNADDFVAGVTQLCRADVDILQLRDRTVDDRTLIERARMGPEIARKHDKIFIMNDRADLALAGDTDGVHVGQDELPVEVARQIVGNQRLVGVSTHSVEQAREAVADGADYIGCGPVFPGRTKQFDGYVGPALIKQVASSIDLPAFAIGGIELDNIDRVIEAGMHRVAVTGAIRDANDPVATAAELKAKLVDSAPAAADG